MVAKLGSTDASGTQGRYAGPPFATRATMTREPEQWYVLWRKDNGAGDWSGPHPSRAVCRGVARSLINVSRVVFAKGKPG